MGSSVSIGVKQTFIRRNDDVETRAFLQVGADYSRPSSSGIRRMYALTRREQPPLSTTWSAMTLEFYIAQLRRWVTIDFGELQRLQHILLGIYHGSAAESPDRMMRAVILYSWILQTDIYRIRGYGIFPRDGNYELSNKDRCVVVPELIAAIRAYQCYLVEVIDDQVLNDETYYQFLEDYVWTKHLRRWYESSPPDPQPLPTRIHKSIATSLAEYH